MVFLLSAFLGLYYKGKQKANPRPACFTLHESARIAKTMREVIRLDMNKKRKWLVYPLGAGAGFLNGLFGAGGGMVAVPMLKALGVPQEACHATSLAVILPLAVASGFLDLNAGSFALAGTLEYLPGGALGALFGAWLLPRIRTDVLRRIFGCLVLLAAVRMFLR
jgi:uncharacterized membrane protein YfcA